MSVQIKELEDRIKRLEDRIKRLEQYLFKDNDNWEHLNAMLEHSNLTKEILDTVERNVHVSTTSTMHIEEV
jgi:chaperonin cofactor prefoldin